jgi:hypothetical protein
LQGSIISRCNQLLRSPDVPGSIHQVRNPWRQAHQDGVRRGIQVGIDFASAARLSATERKRALGAYSVAYDLAVYMMRCDQEELQNGFDRLAFTGMRQLQTPVLCADGRFCEHSIVLRTELEREGMVDCARYGSISSKGWEQLAPMMPPLHAHVGNLRLVESVGVAWLQTGSPFESIIESEAWSFFASTEEAAERGGREFKGGPQPLPEAVQRCALEHLHLVAKERWEDFAAMMYGSCDELEETVELLPQVILMATPCAPGWRLIQSPWTKMSSPAMLSSQPRSSISFCVAHCTGCASASASCGGYWPCRALR